jgi:hypothetical protein
MIVGRGLCLGALSGGAVTQIQGLIRRELALYLRFMRLAERHPHWREDLELFALESFERARLLAAANVSITRRVFWPEALPEPTVRGTLLVELQRIDDELAELEHDYGLFQRRSSDQCLSQIYLRLGDLVGEELLYLEGLISQI